MTTEYDFGLNVNLSTAEARLVACALRLMLGANLPPDSVHRERDDGSFSTDAEIDGLCTKFNV